MKLLEEDEVILYISSKRARPFLQSFRDAVFSRKPTSILVVFGYWETYVPTVNVISGPSNTIHDFYNFPAEMYKGSRSSSKKKDKMIEVVLNDRLGKKVRVKCNEEDTIGDLKKLVAAQTGTRAEKIRIQYKDRITLSDYEIHAGMGLELYYD